MNSTMRKTGLMMVLVLVFLSQSVVVSAATQIVVWHQEQTSKQSRTLRRNSGSVQRTEPRYSSHRSGTRLELCVPEAGRRASAGLQPDVIFVIPDFATTVRNLNLGQPVTDLVEELHASNQFIQAALDPISRKMSSGLFRCTVWNKCFGIARISSTKLELQVLPGHGKSWWRSLEP